MSPVAQQVADTVATQKARYFDALCAAMARIAEMPNAVFLGQAVACPGTAMSNTFRDVPHSQRIEMPVMEDAQLGIATGMAMAGCLPVCVYPRWNFLLLATNQLVNHLDKWRLMGANAPRVIVRAAEPTPNPLHPGPQHLGNFSRAFGLMLKLVRVVELERAEDIVPAYMAAVEAPDSTILVECTGLYA